MSFISSGAIHHRNWNLLLDLNGSGGQIPNGGGGVTKTKTFSFSNPLSTVEINQFGDLGLFDTGLGTLVSTSLTIGSSLNNSVTLTTDNNPTFPKPIVGITNCDVSFHSLIPALEAIIYNHGAGIQDLSTTTGVFTASASTVYPFLNQTDSKSVVYDLTAIQASLKAAGGGLLRLFGLSLTGNLVGGEPGIGGSYSTLAAINGSITYTYTTP